MQSFKKSLSGKTLAERLANDKTQPSIAKYNTCNANKLVRNRKVRNKPKNK